MLDELSGSKCSRNVIRRNAIRCSHVIKITQCDKSGALFLRLFASAVKTANVKRSSRLIHLR